MARREYYSMRRGTNPAVQGLDEQGLAKLLLLAYEDLRRRGYFQEAFGYWCVDAGSVAGNVGEDVAGYVTRLTFKPLLWPLSAEKAYSEDDLFDLVELLHDHSSEPLGGDYHGYNDCGWHYRTFDGPVGQAAFRDEVRPLLRKYGTGFDLTDDGEVVALVAPGLDQLLAAKLPHLDSVNVNARVDAAISRYRSRQSSVDDRREAVRALADVLEYLRPTVKQVLFEKDEGELFKLANGFGIRHHNKDQRTGYDPGIWLGWMFFYYLNTIHVVVRLIKRQAETEGLVGE